MVTEIQPKWLHAFEGGKTACAAQNYAVAEHLFEQALNLSYDDEAPDTSVAEIFFSQGWCFHAQQKCIEAQRSYGQALATFERCCGTGSIEVAEVLQNLASLLCETGRPAQAQPLFDRAWTIIKRKYGGEHPEILAMREQMDEALQNGHNIRNSAIKATSGAPGTASQAPTPTTPAPSIHDFLAEPTLLQPDGPLSTPSPMGSEQPELSMHTVPLPYSSPSGPSPAIMDPSPIMDSASPAVGTPVSTLSTPENTDAESAWPLQPANQAPAIIPTREPSKSSSESRGGIQSYGVPPQLPKPTPDNAEPAPAVISHPEPQWFAQPLSQPYPQSASEPAWPSGSTPAVDLGSQPLAQPVAQSGSHAFVEPDSHSGAQFAVEPPARNGARPASPSTILPPLPTHSQAPNPTQQHTWESPSAALANKRRLPRSISSQQIEGDDADYQAVVANAQSNQGNLLGIDELVHPREKFYGTISSVFGWFCYGMSFVFLVGFFIAPIMALGAWISGGIHKGHLRSHSIKISERQFPEVHKMILDYSAQLSMDPPQVYVCHYDGVLNAFANRFQQRDYMVIASDIFELAYQQGEKEIAFVICHELAHIKRGHVKWAWLHAPAELIPFLGTAYSRSCEYTCDRIARYLVPDGALFGLVALAAGTSLYRHVNLRALYQQQEDEWDFWTWFSEIESTHPNLLNRIRAIGLADEEAAAQFKQPRPQTITNC